HGIGMTITGMPVVNAIHGVVAARPGIVTYADLPIPTGPFLG
ncbi:MAG: dihydrodipicolinate reductase, partial [Marmoricola sp.]|nr:dihydrodipicolinate reductase [Marmoricola sp.]MCW2787371.1 dihydrodipicolinate reductase [Marmoricola sp.]